MTAMAWQNLLVIVLSGVVLVGVVTAVLYVVKVRRERATYKAKWMKARDVIARLNDREEIANMGDEELHNEVLDLLDRYRPDDGGTG